MFRDMTRGECRMTDEEAERALKAETWGVLSLHGDGGFPYGVPMNYAWVNGCVLLHCDAENSHRLDSLRCSEKVCFTVVPKHELDRERWSASYVSVIVFGVAEVITDPAEKREAMRAFMNALAPEKTREALAACDPGAPELAMLRVRPVHITGKRG